MWCKARNGEGRRAGLESRGSVQATSHWEGERKRGGKGCRALFSMFLSLDKGINFADSINPKNK